MSSKTENKEKKCLWKSITAISFAVVMIASIFVIIAPVSASPTQIWPSDEGGMWKDFFGKNVSLASPFLVFGHVYYENGSECNNPCISITNLNTSKKWVAATKEGYNYHQIILVNGTGINASEILRFNATSADASQSNITEHTVTFEEIKDGGLFGFNISLAAPALKTCTTSLTTGWNLISAPLNLTTWELGEEAVVGDPLNVTPKNSLTSIYRYNATSGLFKKCDHFDDWGWWPATGSESFTKLEPGRGYWVMAKNDCVWRYEA